MLSPFDGPVEIPAPEVISPRPPPGAGDSGIVLEEEDEYPLNDIVPSLEDLGPLWQFGETILPDGRISFPEEENLGPVPAFLRTAYHHDPEGVDVLINVLLIRYNSPEDAMNDYLLFTEVIGQRDEGVEEIDIRSRLEFQEGVSCLAGFFESISSTKVYCMKDIFVLIINGESEDIEGREISLEFALILGSRLPK